MRKPRGPRCPRCGYPIFGIRDARCPECGRVLDVRDFNSDADDSRGASRRYERNSAVGGLAGIVVLLVVIVPALMLAHSFLKFGVMPWFLPVAIGFLVVTLIGVAAHTRESIVSWFQSRR